MSCLTTTISKTKKAVKTGKIAMKIKHKQSEEAEEEGDAGEEKVVLNGEEEEEIEEEKAFADAPDVFEVYRTNPVNNISIFSFKYIYTNVYNIFSNRMLNIHCLNMLILMIEFLEL